MRVAHCNALHCFVSVQLHLFREVFTHPIHIIYPSILTSPDHFNSPFSSHFTTPMTYFCQSGLHCSKALIAASEHVEHRINTPLEELQRRIRYRVDVLKDTYAAQLELLEGSAPTSNGEIFNLRSHSHSSCDTSIIHFNSPVIYYEIEIVKYRKK